MKNKNDPLFTSPVKRFKENHIDVEMHLFQNGGHGWGLRKKGTDTEQWPSLMIN